jgi:hypothetical protein
VTDAGTLAGAIDHDVPSRLASADPLLRYGFPRVQNQAVTVGSHSDRSAVYRQRLCNLSPFGGSLLHEVEKHQRNVRDDR